MSEQAIGDERRVPYFWITVSATKAIRTGLVEKDPGLAHVLAVYTALVELANEARARESVGDDAEPFSVERKKLCRYSGTGISTVRGATEALERLGLLRIERRKVAGDRNLPNRYVLVEGVGPSDGPTPPSDGGRVGPSDGGKSFKKNNSQEPPSRPPSEVEEVHQHYVATFGKRGKAAELREDESKIIRAALAAGEVDELKRCITTCERSDYHMKRGKHRDRKGHRYHSLGIILKPRPRYGETQRSRIEWWLEYAAEQEREGEDDAFERFLNKGKEGSS